MPDGDGDLQAGLKALPSGASVQTRFREKADEPVVHLVLRYAKQAGEIPKWGDQPRRDEQLRKLWKAPGNDLLQGAMSSVVKKMNALDWVIQGPKRTAKRLQWMLAKDSEMGKGWLSLLAKGVLDYCSQDKGLFWEIVRETKSISSRIVSIAHLDAARCWATNDSEYPVIYVDKKNKKHKLHDSQVMHIVDIPHPGEDSNIDIGLCAVSRVLKSAKVIQQLMQYKDEKLSTRPVPGIAIAKGITGPQLRAALEDADRQDVEKKGRLMYRGIPVITAISTDYEAGIDLVEFRSVPDIMDMDTEITFFIYTLALAFGVDAREFWPATVTGATKADALIQAQKARGKGPGELIAQLEFQLNTKVLPKNCTFKFDYQDDEEDRLQTEIKSGKVKMVRDMWLADPSTLTGLITNEQAVNLLVDWNILPDSYRVQEPLAEEEEEIVRDVETKELTASWWSKL